MSDELVTPRRSSRDPESLRRGLEAWLATRLPPGAQPRIPEVSSPSGSGMSSETLLFDAHWTENGVDSSGEFVARVEPDLGDVPVFPEYDLQAQFEVMRRVAQHSAVRVPLVRWLELDAGPVGAPFFVMERVAGRVPPDVMPYNMGSWLSEATAAERRRLEHATLGVLAELHEIDIEKAGLGFLEFDLPGDTPLRRHVENQKRYYAWAREDRRHALLERAFEWLDAHWPNDTGQAVLSWGDSRIGNVMYGDWEPVAVLDWEMAALGPRELDLGWLVFMHAFFEGIAGQLGLPGLPDFLRLANVAEHYAELTGYEPADLHWYQVYAALRHGIVMTRVRARQVHFGEDGWPDDPDEAIPHRATLAAMLDSGD